MELNDYQWKVYDGALKSEGTTSGIALEASLSLAGNSGFAIDHIKKVHFHGHPLDTEKLAEYLRDTLRDLARLAAVHGLALEEVATWECTQENDNSSV